MSDALSRTATCLCGAVTVSPAVINPKFTVCHCASCRKWSTGPLFMLQCGEDVTFDGKEAISEYDSSAWAARGFCNRCGTNLFVRFKHNNSFNVPVGLFPDVEGLEMSMQYFIDSKPDYYCFSNETPTLTEAEILAYFADKM
uniref:GFA family protein n=1 Tax=Thaumasiovibrio occultus TaxID=1891184 RepID=UPI000B35FA17|nr:GFA family protein [Thaumasiovibrio occultus]